MSVNLVVMSRLTLIQKDDNLVLIYNKLCYQRDLISFEQSSLCMYCIVLTAVLLVEKLSAFL